MVSVSILVGNEYRYTLLSSLAFYSPLLVDNARILLVDVEREESIVYPHLATEASDEALATSRMLYEISIGERKAEDLKRSNLYIVLEMVEPKRGLAAFVVPLSEKFYSVLTAIYLIYEFGYTLRDAINDDIDLVDRISIEGQVGFKLEDIEKEIEELRRVIEKTRETLENRGIRKSINRRVSIVTKRRDIYDIYSLAKSLRSLEKELKMDFSYDILYMHDFGESSIEPEIRYGRELIIKPQEPVEIEANVLEVAKSLNARIHVLNPRKPLKGGFLGYYNKNGIKIAYRYYVSEYLSRILRDPLV